MRLQREALKLGSYCVISPPCENGTATWIVDRHIMLGEGEVAAGVTERAYPYQGDDEGWHEILLGGEVVTCLGSGKICCGNGAHELAIGHHYRYFWRQRISVDIQRGGGDVDVGRSRVGIADLVMG